MKKHSYKTKNDQRTRKPIEAPLFKFFIHKNPKLLLCQIDENNTKTNKK